MNRSRVFCSNYVASSLKNEETHNLSYLLEGKINSDTTTEDAPGVDHNQAFVGLFAPINYQLFVL